MRDGRRGVAVLVVGMDSVVLLFRWQCTESDPLRQEFDGRNSRGATRNFLTYGRWRDRAAEPHPPQNF